MPFKIVRNDITKMDKKHVRQHVGIILQEPFLYSRTIKENIIQAFVDT